jgi:hypothetical protein
VIKALQEIEMGGVMGIGEVGQDGKVGGRLERELEVWEGVVRGKRKGYREKVKMRESGTGVGGTSEEDGSKEGDGESGERDAKRARVEEDAASSGVGAQSTMPPPHPANAANGQPLTNGAAKAAAGDEDVHEEDEDGEDDADVYDEGSASADGDGDGDETQPDEEDDPEDEEEPAPDEEELDGYGAEDQLRHDMNGDETGDESD